MKITAAMAASVALLTEALDEPGADIARSVHQLTLDAVAAIPSFLGLSVVVSQSDPPITLTALADEAVAADIHASLQVLLPGGRGRVPIALILYAGAQGTFVDLAADLARLTMQPLTDFVLDQHFAVPTRPDTSAQLQAASHINQALGVLIGRGYTPRQAHQHLDAQALNNRTTRHTVAQLILDEAASDEPPALPQPR